MATETFRNYWGETVTRTPIYIEIHDGHPHEVICRETRTYRDGQTFTTHGDYDFEYSRKYQATYYQSSGDGPIPTRAVPAPRAAYWADPAALAHGDLQIGQWVQEGDNWIFTVGAPQAQPITRLPRGYRRATLFTEAGETDGVWCDQCNDWLPDNGLCEHRWWCEVCNWWNTECDHPIDAEEAET